MEDHILAERIANSIMMDSSFTGSYLIVEGSTDFKLYNKFISQSDVRIKQSFGCEKVKLTVQILNQRGFTRKIGIIDSDFNKILCNEIKTEGVFLTDDHDIEVMMFRTSALEMVAAIYVDSIKSAAFFKSIKQDLRSTVLNIAKKIAYLKLANKKHTLGLVFKPNDVDGNQVRYSDFIDVKKFIFKNDKSMITSIMNYSRCKSEGLKTEQEINKRFIDEQLISYNIYQLVNGHDIVNILYIFFKKTMRTKNKMLQDQNAIEDSLVMSFEYEFFKETDLYNDIDQWSFRNSIKIWK